MILKGSLPVLVADTGCRDENILEKVGEARQWQGISKGRFFMAESLAIGS
jgi:hypothetical protein